jgi:trehalose 6-phosphate phosphatase
VHDVPAVLLPLRERPGDAALFLDYDGTLAPIVDDPTAARPLPGVPDVLDRLAGRFGLVAVVSGRPVAFLLDMLGKRSGVQVVGLYGMETARPGGDVRSSAAAAAWRPVVAEVTRQAVGEAPEGADVEAKGLTVTLHWRRSPETERWARRFAARETARTGLVPMPGRMALELRPPVHTDKGVVVRRMAAGRAAVGCFGDDLGDLPAFRALSELAARGVAVARVAVADAESPPEVAAAADMVVDGPAGALALLSLLAGAT